jgi:hypothetical protein
MKEDLIKIVEKLNNNLPRESMFCFSLVTSQFWDSICICYLSSTISLWDSENESNPTYNSVLGEFQKIVLELFHISQIGKVIESGLSHLYTDLLMLGDGTWIPDESSIRASLNNLGECAESILELELKDNRE